MLTFFIILTVYNGPHVVNLTVNTARYFTPVFLTKHSERWQQFQWKQVSWTQLMLPILKEPYQKVNPGDVGKDVTLLQKGQIIGLHLSEWERKRRRGKKKADLTANTSCNESWRWSKKILVFLSVWAAHSPSCSCIGARNKKHLHNHT